MTQTSKITSSVVKIASQLAESDELTSYPYLSERNRARNRWRRGSAPDRRSESQNRGSVMRFDSGRRRTYLTGSGIATRLEIKNPLKIIIIDKTHRFINVVLAVKVTTAWTDSIALICFGFFFN
jgi:hypothetical protein